MGEANDSLLIHQKLGGHPAQFEKVDLLTEPLQNRVPWIGKALEGKAMFRPEVGEGVPPFRPDHDNLGIPPTELIIALAQLRHVPSAKQSAEAPVEDQHYVSLPLEIRQADPSTVEILQVEVRGRSAQFYSRHLVLFPGLKARWAPLTHSGAVADGFRTARRSWRSLRFQLRWKRTEAYAPPSHNLLQGKPDPGLIVGDLDIVL